MIKFILFLIIILIIYFIATRIQVIHIDKLPEKEKTDLNNRNKIRTMLLANHIKCYDNQKNENFENIPNRSDASIISNTPNTSTNSSNLSDRELPDADELLDIIKSEYVNSKFKFNIANQPVTSRYSNKNTKIADHKYIKYIKNNIKKWNDFFENMFKNGLIHVIEIKPIFVKETENEFFIKVNVKLFYQEKTLHLELTYYGQIEKSDDFLNGGNNVYNLQLVEIKPLTKSDYNASIEESNRNKNNPFMTMSEQLLYVDKINKMHREEEYQY